MIDNTNGFSSTVAEYSDQKILTILNAPEDYSRIITDACKIEAKKRDILNSNKFSSSKTITQEMNFVHVTEIRNLLSQGKTQEECEHFLQNKGLDVNYVYKVINKAKNPSPKPTPSQYEKKDYYGLKLGTVLFLVYVTIKLLTRL